jgi:hypothetical protein
MESTCQSKPIFQRAAKVIADHVACVCVCTAHARAVNISRTALSRQCIVEVSVGVGCIAWDGISSVVGFAGFEV